MIKNLKLIYVCFYALVVLHTIPFYYFFISIKVITLEELEIHLNFKIKSPDLFFKKRFNNSVLLSRRIVGYKFIHDRKRNQKFFFHSYLGSILNILITVGLKLLIVEIYSYMSLIHTWFCAIITICGLY